ESHVLCRNWYLPAAPEDGFTALRSPPASRSAICFKSSFTSTDEPLDASLELSDDCVEAASCCGCCVDSVCGACCCAGCSDDACCDCSLCCGCACCPALSDDCADASLDAFEFEPSP